MAEREPERGGGGSGASKKLGPLPYWAWALIVGAGAGILWYWRRNAGGGQVNPAAGDMASQTETEGGEPPTNIVPVNQGLGTDQAQAILDAIKELQGEISKEEEEDEEEEKPGKTTLPAPIPKPPFPRPKPKPKPKPPKRPTKPKSIFIKAKHGDTYTKIAHRYHMTAAELWAYQLKPGVRPAKTQAELRRRGINHALFSGSGVAIPVAIPASKAKGK